MRKHGPSTQRVAFVWTEPLHQRAISCASYTSKAQRLEGRWMIRCKPRKPPCVVANTHSVHTLSHLFEAVAPVPLPAPWRKRSTSDVEWPTPNGRGTAVDQDVVYATRGVLGAHRLASCSITPHHNMRWRARATTVAVATHIATGCACAVLALILVGVARDKSCVVHLPGNHLPAAHALGHDEHTRAHVH